MSDMDQERGVQGQAVRGPGPPRPAERGGGREEWPWPTLGGGGLEVQTPGSFSAAAREHQPELLAWAGSEVTRRLDHLMDGHRLFLPYLMAGHFPAFSGDASPSVKLTALPLLHSPFTGRVCVAVRVLDPWREFGVWVEPRHLAHRDCGVCTPVWAARLTEFEAAQADLARAVAGGAEEYVPILFAQTDLNRDLSDMTSAASAPESESSTWRTPRVIVHAADLLGAQDSGASAVGQAGPAGVGDGHP